MIRSRHLRCAETGECPELCRFSDAGNDEARTSWEAGVGKAPRHEIAGGEGTVGGAGAMGILAAASGWARLD